MNLNSLFEQVLGGAKSHPVASKIAGNWGGLAGGAAAGSLMGLLVGSKHTRKALGAAATYGGMAVLGGLAFRAFQNWQQRPALPPHGSSATPGNAALNNIALDNIALPAPFTASESLPDGSSSLEVALVKTMIAAAKADGHLDSADQKRIFDHIQNSQMSAAQKAIVLDCFGGNCSVEELARSVKTIEHKAELYLAACLVECGDDARGRAFLTQLAAGLELPTGLVQHLEAQAGAGEQTTEHALTQNS